MTDKVKNLLSKGNKENLYPFTVAVMIVIICLMAAMLFLMNRSFSKIDEIDKLENSRGYCETAIGDFSDASDYLTNQIQEYSIDNDWTHVVNYWKEVNSTRTRDKAIEKLLHSDLTDQEKTHVLRAKAYSDNLMNKEIWAFKMIAEGNDVSADKMPAEVSAFQLSAADKALSDTGKKEAARKYLFGSEYAQSKDTIKEMIRAFNADLASRLETVTAKTFKENKKMVMIFWIFFAAMLVLIMAIMHVYSASAIERNRRLEKALEKAEAANEAKSYFTSRMSHEIRTPLNAVLGFLAIASETGDPVRQKDSVEKSRTAAVHLMNIVNDVLDYSAIENNKLTLISKPFSIADAMQEMKVVYSALTENKNITYSVICEKMEYDIVSGDSMRTNQILNNLLSNAVKFTPENGSIELRAAQKNENGHILVTYTVKDNGAGISKEFLPHIFEPYEQQTDTISPQFKGTGLGMSIVKTLVDMMGGVITVESRQGSGSLFTVEIPYERPSADILSASGSEKTEKPHKDLRGRHVLLVEDNIMNREIAETILSDAGADITDAVDGREALEIFRKSAPGEFDLVIMDIIMPEMDGYEATERIRSSGHADANLPIIAMTANAFASDIEKALASGMNGHIAKPIDRDAMFRTINDVLAKGR
jgi:Signal transduction histidine kinase